MQKSIPPGSATGQQGLGGTHTACSAPFAPISDLLCLFSSELRILLLCGSDLLESFCIPGLWNEADVSHCRPCSSSSSSPSHTQCSWEPLVSLGMAGAVPTVPSASSIPALTLISPTHGQPEGQDHLLLRHQPYPASPSADPSPAPTHCSCRGHHLGCRVSLSRGIFEGSALTLCPLEGAIIK